MFVTELPSRKKDNVVLGGENVDPKNTFALADPIKSITWLDTGLPADYTQADGKVTVSVVPTPYGENYVVKIAKITL